MAEPMPFGRAQIVRDPAVVLAGSVAAVAAVAATMRWGARGFALSAGSALVAAPLARVQLGRAWEPDVVAFGSESSSLKVC
ncbi:MAG TPA: hypothetical protein VFS43_15435 [Polyangiaceae bacterium]|nr:hypothetical protein [Polyangiaceae bacterium]